MLCVSYITVAQFLFWSLWLQLAFDVILYQHSLFWQSSIIVLSFDLSCTFMPQTFFVAVSSAVSDHKTTVSDNCVRPIVLSHM